MSNDRTNSPVDGQNTLNNPYPAILAAIKARILSGRVRAALAANREMLWAMYQFSLNIRSATKSLRILFV